MAERRNVHALIKRRRVVLAIVAEWDDLDAEVAAGRLGIQEEQKKQRVLLAALRDRDRIARNRNIRQALRRYCMSSPDAHADSLATGASPASIAACPIVDMC